MVAINLEEKFRDGELDLSNCNLGEIPKEILSLKNITTLNLSENKLNSVNKIVGQLPNLRKLILSHNHIKGLPENIGNLKNLQHLDLSNNNLTTLPTTLSKLKNLKVLNVNRNPLAPKFVDIIGTCRNEHECKIAAKNIKSLTNNTNNEKNKKTNADQENKKNKQDKKSQNSRTQQQKLKDRKYKKSDKGFFGILIEKFLWVFRLMLAAVVGFIIMMYILSFTDKSRYESLKNALYPYWHSTVTRVLTPEQTAVVEARLILVGSNVNQTIVSTTKLAIEQSNRFYTYLTTDKTVLYYVNTSKKALFDLWAKIIETLSGDGKQKS